MLSENELLNMLQNEPEKGLERAIDMYGKSVKTICQSVLSGYSAQDIEEAVSDAFVGLWQSRERIVIKNGEGLKTYLYGIARRTALNKKRLLAKEQFTEELEEAKGIATKQDVEQETIEHMENEILCQLIFDMGSPDKEIFYFRYFRQNTVKEIAEKLAMQTKTVENKLSRGKKKLKEQLLKVGIFVA